MRFTHAIVRPPSSSYAAGLTSAAEGPPDLGLALAQHRAYCAALTDCGLEVVALPPDAAHPDSCFVEDTAIVTAHGAILTRPGAPSRQGEAAAIEPALRERFPDLVRIEAPGTVDGGDVCEAGDRFFIGLSARTNEAGAAQLSGFLAARGYRARVVDIRGSATLLHLKSGISYLGGGCMVVTPDLAGHPLLQDYTRVVTSPGEDYSANCVAINGSVLVAAGYPRLTAALAAAGHAVLPLEMSEFRKMDGGLSCLSLRLPVAVTPPVSAAGP